MKYAIVKNGKYLSSLFSDSEIETFGSERLRDAYLWDIKQVAIDIAAKYGAEVVPVIP